MSSLLFVCLFVYQKNTQMLWTDFHENWWVDEALAKDESVSLWD